MRLIFVLALLAALGGSYYYKQFDKMRCQKLREECRMVEDELKQCETAERVIREERRRLAWLLKENKKLKARLQAKK